MSKACPRYIGDGFKDDCKTLLSKFAATNSASFADFVKVWQEMKFSLIYCGLNSFAELLEFTEEALSISKQLFLPPHSDISRIGALYLVYGVYTQQPTRGLVKIRMTPEDWLQTIDFIANVREYGYADANFIFHFLCYQAAFTFTACVKEYGLERAYRRHHLATNHVREMMSCNELTTNQLIKPVFEEINVDELEKIRKKYESCKSLLAVNEPGQGMEFTSVTPLEDVVSTLRKVVDSFMTDQAEAGTSNEEESRSDDGRPSGSRNIGHERLKLRNKAFRNKQTGQNHLKSCLSTNEDTEEPSTSTSAPPEIPEEVTPSDTKGLDILRGKVFERSIFSADLSRTRAKKKSKSCACAANADDAVAAESADDPVAVECADDPVAVECADVPVAAKRADDPDPLDIEEDMSRIRRSKRINRKSFKFSYL